jgi:hypothetical protein
LKHKALSSILSTRKKRGGGSRREEGKEGGREEGKEEEEGGKEERTLELNSKKLVKNNLIRKWAKDVQRYFMKEDLQMANKTHDHEMQIKTIYMKRKNTDNTKCW